MMLALLVPIYFVVSNGLMRFLQQVKEVVSVETDGAIPVDAGQRNDVDMPSQLADRESQVIGRLHVAADAKVYVSHGVTLSGGS